MMRGRRVVVGASLLGLSASACQAEEPIEKPRLSVYRIDGINDCYETCQADALVEDDLGAPDRERCQASSGTEAEVSPCVFAPGRDAVRIVVDLDEVIFDTRQALPAVDLTTLVDGEALAEHRMLQGQRTNGDRAFAIGEFLAPLRRRGDLRFVATIAEGFSRSSEVFSLDDPALAVAFSSCTDACSFAAGAGKTTVELDVPRGLETVELVSFIDQVQQPSPQTVTVVGDPGQGLFVEVDIPARPLTTWGLAVRSETLPRSPLVTAALTQREPLQLGAVALDAPAEGMQDGQFPARIALEPRRDCRSVRVVVRSPQAVSGQQVAVTAMHGLLGAAGGATQTLTFGTSSDDGLLASTTFDLGPMLVPGARVELTASSAELGQISRSWSLGELRPATAELYIPGSPQPVDTTGTPPLVITGLLTSPSLELAGEDPIVGPKFSPGTEVIVQLQANADPDAFPLDCGLPEVDHNIDCDRRPGEERGGCTWTPDPVEVSPEGEFSLTLPQGQCFVGELTLAVFAPTYDPFDAGLCLGEQAAPTTSLERLAGPYSLVYEPT